jgi:hypothetical protein
LRRRSTPVARPNAIGDRLSCEPAWSRRSTRRSDGLLAGGVIL